MSRPIDGDALLRRKRKICGVEYVMVSDILRAPTYGERHGVWMLRYDGRNFIGYTCSVCGEYVELDTPNVCPRCKSLMDGGVRR